VYFTRSSLSLWTMLGFGIVAHSYFSLSRVFARLAMQQTRVFGSGIFKNASFGPLTNLYKHVSLVEVYRFWTVLRLEILAHINFLISRKFSRVW